MNTSKLKTYAPAARAAFIEAVTRRAGVFGIRPGAVEAVSETGDVAMIGGQAFPRSVVPLRKKLVERIGREGFDAVMDAAAYTWFNRLVAIRFMEIHGYFDHGFCVFSDPQGGQMPEILQKAEQVSITGLDRDEVVRLKLAGNRDEELYRLLLSAQCQELNRIMPDVFGKLDDETLLLLPDNLLHSDSLVRQLVAASDPADWQEVEVLGWLYQFYISEKKDAVMGRKSAVPKEDIPAVTQLFTPHWIVRYLVENSLGRLWLLNRPHSKLREHMPYYIEGQNTAPGGSRAETDFLRITKPEDVRLCDPAVGSGHMLTYAFDLLYLIYEEEGYAPGDIPGLILKNNLTGLEICPRAAQLAEIALVFKAREKARRFFQPGQFVRPNIVCLQDVRFADGELRDYVSALNLGDLFDQPVLKLMHQFEEATNFGSLIQPCLEGRAIADLRNAIEAKDLGGQLFLRETHRKVLRVLEQAEALTQRYHVVVANPPYMGGNGMNVSVREFMREEYSSFKSDLFSAFTYRSSTLALSGGHIGYMSPNVWMYISSHEGLRQHLLKAQILTGLVELPLSGFSGATVQICAFTCTNSNATGYKAAFIRLLKFRGVDNMGPKTLEAIAHPECGWFFRASPSDLQKIPGSPIAYWASDAMISAFENLKSLSDIGKPRQGLATTDNDRFLRLWFEVSALKSCYTARHSKEAVNSQAKWFPCQKGGPYRKWFGNNEWVVNWADNGKEIKDLVIARYGSASKRVANESLYFTHGISWSTISSSLISMRFVPHGFIFETKGAMCFFENDALLKTALGFANSAVINPLLECISPTLDFHEGPIGRLPIANPRSAIEEDVGKCVGLARADWDNFETSWDFRDQPLLRPGLKGATLEASWRNWEAQSIAAIRRMQELETENNRLFIAAYGLEGELQPEVPEEQITLARADARKDMAAFLSYGVGCMMGRYSPDHPGLILANAGDTLREFLGKVGKPLAELTFAPDEDGIIPVLDGEWFEDDIVARTRDFLRATFGPQTLDQNVAWMENALGKDLRKYFLNDLYKDHLQAYKNRPIYWLFSSGKQQAFQCLVYLHRYTPGTLARMRTEYVIPLQGKIAARIAHLEEEKTHATASTQRKKLQTEQDKLVKQQTELRAFDEQLRHYADQRIALDLDDGVKVNYAKFGPLVAEAKKVCGKKEED